MKVFAAEGLKQHRRMASNKTMVFSQLLWPLLELFTIYFTIRPVADSGEQRWPLAATPGGLLAFLATGALGFAFFFALVQSAWHFSFERQTGTLELLFLSPANRLVLVIANGVGALVQNLWLFLCFAGALVFVPGVLRLAHPAMFVVVFLALLIPAIAWGAFLNSMLIFSRDSAFLFTVFSDPMAFVSGARIPVAFLPGWIAAVGTVLPLTASLVVVRGALLQANTLADLGGSLIQLAVISAVLVALAALLLKLGERRAQRTGQLRLF